MMYITFSHIFDIFVFGFVMGIFTMVLGGLMATRYAKKKDKK